MPSPHPTFSDAGQRLPHNRVAATAAAAACCRVLPLLGARGGAAGDRGPHCCQQHLYVVGQQAELADVGHHMDVLDACRREGGEEETQDHGGPHHA